MFSRTLGSLGLIHFVGVGFQIFWRIIELFVLYGDLLHMYGGRLFVFPCFQRSMGLVYFKGNLDQSYGFYFSVGVPTKITGHLFGTC